MDPWGGETWRSSSASFQPHEFTSYERDANGGDDAMMRRYQSYWNRFSQPDPYDGSYDATNPQSFNRYSYVQNDPVNFVDPMGMDISLPGIPFLGPPIGPTAAVTIPISFNSPIDFIGFGGEPIVIHRNPISESEPRPGGRNSQNPAPTPQGTTCTSVNADLGEGGQGWYRYGNAGRLNYGQPGFVAVLTNFASNWNQSHPSNPIGIGDLSTFGGAADRNRHPGLGHPGGTVVDIRPMRNDSISGPTTINARTYDRALTNQLIQGVRQLPGFSRALFNDPKIQGVRPAGGHSDHIHVELISGAGCGP